MKHPTDYKVITQKKLRKHSNIEHNICQYVDNSTNSIGRENIKELVWYTKDYFKLLKTYYQVNKLKLNDSKNNRRRRINKKINED